MGTDVDSARFPANDETFTSGFYYIDVAPECDADLRSNIVTANFNGQAPTLPEWGAILLGMILMGITIRFGRNSAVGRLA
jgi:hypothetical protein